MSMFEDILFPQNFDEGVEFMPLFSIGDEEDEEIELSGDFDDLPLLALKNTVLFPGIVIPITVGRDKSIKAINEAYDDDRLIGVISQRSSKIEDPKMGDLFQVGTLARIMKLLKMPDGTITAILQGQGRFALKNVTQTDPFLIGQVETLEDIEPTNEREFKAITASIRDLAKQIIELSPNIPSEAAVILRNIDNNVFLLNFIASNLGVKIDIKQAILEINDLAKKAEMI